MESTKIKCPVCVNDEIIIDLKVMLNGGSFLCPNCQSSINLAPKSKETLQKGVEEYENIVKNKR